MVTIASLHGNNSFGIVDSMLITLMGLNTILNCRPDVSQDNGGDIPAAS